MASPSSAFFADLPANALGCFAMGLLLPGAAAVRLFPSLEDEEEDDGEGGGGAGKLPALAAGPRLAFRLGLSGAGSGSAAPLLAGFRTGFCGTLTTFASWSQQCVAMLAAGDVLGGMAGYALGMQASYFRPPPRLLSSSRRPDPRKREAAFLPARLFSLCRARCPTRVPRLAVRLVTGRLSSPPPFFPRNELKYTHNNTKKKVGLASYFAGAHAALALHRRRRQRPPPSPPLAPPSRDPGPPPDVAEAAAPSSLSFKPPSGGPAPTLLLPPPPLAPPPRPQQVAAAEAAAWVTGCLVAGRWWVALPCLASPFPLSPHS